MAKKKPMQDVPRLLQLRGRVGELQPGIASSVTAFLAWKAFLVTAKCFGTGAERDRCVARFAEAIAQEQHCRQSAGAFADALLLLSEQGNVAVAEWLAVDEDDEPTRDRKVARFKRDVRRLSPRAKRGDLPVQDRFIVADCAVAFRHSVIAHGSVYSTGNLFQLIVPPFDSFVCSVACQGYAQRLGLPYPDAMNECSLNGP